MLKINISDQYYWSNFSNPFGYLANLTHLSTIFENFRDEDVNTDFFFMQKQSDDWSIARTSDRRYSACEIALGNIKNPLILYCVDGNQSVCRRGAKMRCK